MPKIIVAMCISITLLVTTACVPRDLYLPQLKSNEGLVLLTLNANHEEVTVDHKNWSTVIIQQISKHNDTHQKEFYLSSLGEEHPNAYYQILPEGRYIISGLVSHTIVNDQFRSFQLSTLGSSLTFEIKADQILNLGSIVFQPATPTTILNQWGGEIHYRDRYRQLPGAIYQQKKNNHYILRELLATDKSKGKVAEKIFNMAVLDHEPSIQISQKWIKPGLRKSFKKLANGTSVAFGKLGTWSILHKDKWVHHRLPSNDEITDITLTKESYIISTNTGEVYQSPIFGDTTAPAQFIRQIDNIKRIIHSNNDLYIVTKSHLGITIYTTPAIDQKLNEVFKVKKDTFDRAHEAFSANTNKNGELILHAYGSRYKSSNIKWDKTNTYGLKHISKNIDDGVYTAVSYSGYYFYSKNDGENWIKFNRSTYPKFIQTRKYTPILFSNGDSFLIASSQYKSSYQDERNQNPILYEDLTLTKLQFKNESIVETVLQRNQPETCYGLLPEISTKDKIYMICNTDTLKFSTDLGRTWEVDPTFSLIDKPKVNDTAVLAM